MLIYALYSANAYCNLSMHSTVQVHILCHPMCIVHLVYTVQCACTPTQTQSQLPQMELVQGKKKY